MFYSISRFFCFLIFKLVFRIEVYGRENIPKKGGFILASNHVSYLDPPAVGVACRRKLNYMARDDLFRNPLFSWLLSKLGVFPVKKNSADVFALKTAIKCVKNGKGLLLFPEGRRKEVGAVVSNPQPGIGFLVTKLNVPTIPAYVRGTDKALPKGAKFIRPEKICVYFGKQIYIERRMPYQDIAEEIMKNIRHLSC